VPPIRCLYVDCAFIEEGYCTAPAIDLDPEEGCLTYEGTGAAAVDEEWEDETLGDLWHEDDEILYEDADEEDWYEAEDFDD
jgi:hypothetical protein